MKIRQDFVTNSSSSSYIIAFKSMPTIDNETKKKYPWLENITDVIWDMIQKSGSNSETTSTEFYETKEELDEALIYEHKYYVHPLTLENVLKYSGYEDLYKEMVDYLNKGYKIIKKEVAYSDSAISTIIGAIATNNDDFIILEG